MIQAIIDGYYSEKECKAIKEVMQDKTFFNFDIAYSNCAGNCILVVKSDNQNGYTPQELKEMFIYACISELAQKATE